MEEIEREIFQIISNVGMAKSKYIDALQHAKKNDSETYGKLMEEGDKFMAKGHEIHTQFIQQEAAGKQTHLSLLLIHAEDQFMNTETIKFLVEENSEIHKKINNMLQE